MAAPSPEEVRFEARELVQRSGWGLPLIDRLRKVADPYWREAITRCLMERWNELVRDKDEQTYYYDSDGDVRYCWMDAEYDFSRIIRRCTAEQVEQEQSLTEKPTHTMQPFQPLPPMQPTRNNRYNQYNNYGTINQIGTQNNYYYATPMPQMPHMPHNEESAPEPETDCLLFTRKARQEGQEAEIIQSLQQAIRGRNDKARALVDAIRQWQKEGYIDANYNARVMYEQLNKIIPLPFQYPGFRKYYTE